MIPFVWNFQNRQIYRDAKQISGCQELRGRGNDCGYVVSFWHDENVLELDSDLMVEQHWEYIKSYWVVYFHMFKLVGFMLYGFYHTHKISWSGQKTWIGSLIKKISSWPINIWKSAQPHLSSGKLQIKPQCSIITYLLGYVM